MLVSSLCRINCENSESELAKLEEILPNYKKGKTWLEENKEHIVL